MRFQYGQERTFVIFPYRIHMWLCSKRVSPAAHKVFVCLLYHLSFPGAEEREIDLPGVRIQLECGFKTTRSVERAIAELVELGVVTSERRLGLPNLYHLQDPGDLKGTDHEVMAKLKFCPCKWNGKCKWKGKRHPSGLTGA